MALLMIRLNDLYLRDDAFSIRLFSPWKHYGTFNTNYFKAVGLKVQGEIPLNPPLKKGDFSAFPFREGVFISLSFLKRGSHILPLLGKGFPYSSPPFIKGGRGGFYGV